MPPEIVFHIIPVYPKYSFVQNSEPNTQGCNDDPKFCLPLSDPANLQFQVEMQYMGDPGSHFNLFAIPVPCDAVCTDHYDEPYTFTGPADDLSGHTSTHNVAIESLLPFALFTSPAVQHIDFANYQAFFDTCSGSFDSRSSLGTPVAFIDHVTTPGIGIDYVHLSPIAATSVILASIEPGQCFKLQYILEIVDGSGTITFRHYAQYCSNCFIRTMANECFTSVVTYSNQDDAFDFVYTSHHSNKVELPVYLRDPVMNNDTKVYTKSDGSITKLYERKEEQYILETDLMPYAWHKALDVALSHDSVRIQNPNANAFDPVNTAQYFVKKENYEIEYQKAPLSMLGKGTCNVVNTAPVHLINNNCA